MHRPAFRRLTLVLITVLAGLPLSGCMLTRPDSGPAFRYVQEHLVPENRTAQYALLPVFIPVGAAAALTDAAIIHPAMIIDDTAEETANSLWSHMKWDEQYITESAALPWRTVATPIFFTGMWVGRVLFEIPREADRLRAEEAPDAEATAEERARIMAEAQEFLDTGKPEEALKLLIANQDIRWEAPGEEQQAYVLMIFRAALDSGRYEIFEEFSSGPYFQVRMSDQFGELLEEMIASENPYARGVAYGWKADSATRGEGYHAARDVLHQMLGDESEVVRALGLLRFRPWSWSRESLGPQLFTKLEHIKANDPSTWNREKAAAVLRQLLDDDSERQKPEKPLPPRAQ